MRVVLTSFYYKPHFGGVENSLYHLAVAYKKAGHEVIIACSDAAPARRKRLPAREIVDGIDVRRFKSLVPWLPLLHFLAPIFNAFSCVLMARAIERSFHPDVVLARHHLPGLAFLMATSAAVIYLVPGIVSRQDTISLPLSGIPYRQKLKNVAIKYILIPQSVVMQKVLIRRAKKTLVFSENMKKQVEAFAGPRAPSPAVVRPGVDRKRFSPRAKAIIRKELRIPMDYTVFLCLGRVTVHKGFDRAIKAMSGLPSTSNSILLIVGSGPESSSLKKMVEQLDLSARVRFFDRTDQAERFYWASDVFLMTSVHETFGQTILEAFASGLPVVAFKPVSNVIETASDELVLDGHNGFLVSHEGDQLSLLLKSLVDRKDLLQELGKNARRRAEDYSWDDLAAKAIN